jgi:hypothetical protein
VRNTKRNGKGIQTASRSDIIICNMNRFMKYHGMFVDSIKKTLETCQEINDERINHISMIQTKRNETIYDKDNMFIDEVIDRQGKEEYILFMNEMKKEILGNDKVKETKLNVAEKTPMYSDLQSQCIKWQKLVDKIQWIRPSSLSKTKETHWYHVSKCLKRQIKVIINTIHQVRQDEWLNSKMHLICIGKYGQIARMVNPKVHKGPTAGSHYPSKFGEPPRRAINDTERKEASLQTHELWISDPPGGKDCHFLDII